MKMYVIIVFYQHARDEFASIKMAQRMYCNTISHTLNFCSLICHWQVLKSGMTVLVRRGALCSVWAELWLFALQPLFCWQFVIWDVRVLFLVTLCAACFGQLMKIFVNGKCVSVICPCCFV